MQRFAPPRRPTADHYGRTDDPDPQHIARLREQLAQRQQPASRGEKPDPGTVIVDLSRGKGLVLRLALKTFPSEHGPRPYVDLRLWSDNGYPIKGKGVSIRPSDVVPLATALLEAADLLARRSGP